MANLCIGENFSEELTCAVCLDSWKDPVELQDCQHVLCRDCVKSMTECPICRASIKSVETAHRTLVNLAQQVQVKCGRCGWSGTREQSMHHTCDPNKVAEMAQQQQQQFYNHNYSTTNNGNSNSNGGGGANAGSAGVGNGSNAPRPHGGQGYNSNTATSSAGHNGNYAHNSHAAHAPPGSLPQRPSLPTPYNAYTGQQRPSNIQELQQRRQRRYVVIEPSGSTPWVEYNMTQVEYDQVVSLFVYFDTDESGRLDRSEVAQLARWLNFAQTDEDIRRIFDEMDSDHSGSLSLGEFLTWLRYNRPNPDALYGLTQAQYNTIMMQFHTYDTDRDGFLGVDEFTRLVMNIGDVRDMAKGHKLFQMIDRNQSGRVSLHEFLRFRAGRV